MEASPTLLSRITGSTRGTDFAARYATASGFSSTARVDWVEPERLRHACSLRWAIRPRWQSRKFAAHRGAIETYHQERYVRKSAKVSTDEAYADRVLGCLLGGAVGDALGYEVEFDSSETIRRRFGAKGIAELQLHDGLALVSDDTQMTLFTLEGALRALKHNSATEDSTVITQIDRAYQDWLATQEAHSRWKPAGALFKDRFLHHRRAPGNTVMRALRSRHAIADQKGCGGVMRVAPLGLVRAWSAERAFELGARAAALTHQHPTSDLSSGAMATIVRLVLEGGDLSHAANDCLKMIAARPHHEETTAAVSRALTVTRGKLGNGLGQGWIAEEALSIGLNAALAGTTFEGALRLAANHDGDSDSTASIAGQLYGAWRGLSGLPNRWVRNIDVPATVAFVGQRPDSRRRAFQG